MDNYTENFNNDLSPEDVVTIEYYTRLTSAEIGALWASYQQYTLLTCVFRYFRETDDEDTRYAMERALDLCEKRVKRCREIFRMTGANVPLGFAEEDLNEGAPELYSDSFRLYYLKQMIGFGLKLNTDALMLATAPVVEKFYNDCVTSSLELNEILTDIQKYRGIMISPPIITVSNSEFIKSSGFMRGFLGDKRPLLATEIAHLSFNYQMNYIGQVLLTGFAQVAQSNQVKDYFFKGSKQAGIYVNQLTAKLRDFNVPTPFPSDATISTSKTAPFSDKLMLFHVGIMNSFGMGAYGDSMAASLRRDIVSMYAKIMVDVGRYAEEGVKLLISKGWMEEPPKIVDHKKLAYKH